MIAKTEFIDLDLNTLKPVQKNVVKVIRGTESGHFYNVQINNDDLLIGFRRLSENYSKSDPTNGPETRIRVVAKSDAALNHVKTLMRFLDFNCRLYMNEERAHYSKVVTNAKSVLCALAKIVEV